MRTGLIVLVLLLAWAAHEPPLQAQTATPSPTPTGTEMLIGPLATMDALPTYNPLAGTATRTPYPTMSWPTLTPGALGVRPWSGVGKPEMTPGGAYRPPNRPAFDAPDAFYEDTANGLSAINDGNLTTFMVFLVDVALSFYQWFAVNFPKVLFGMRWFVLIMIALYGIFLWWRGSRFRPPDAETAGEQYESGAFLRSFRMGGRTHAISQRRVAAREARNRKTAERELRKRDLL